jgi:hypothetical protein
MTCQGLGGDSSVEDYLNYHTFCSCIFKVLPGMLGQEKCNTIIYSCLCGSLLESVQEGNGGNDI